MSAETIAGLEARQLDYIIGARERNDAAVLKAAAVRFTEAECQAIRQIVSPLAKIAHDENRDILLGQALGDVCFHARVMLPMSPPRVAISAL